jgi:hypothetical protein
MRWRLLFWPFSRRPTRTHWVEISRMLLFLYSCVNEIPVMNICTSWPNQKHWMYFHDSLHKQWVHFLHMPHIIFVMYTIACKTNIVQAWPYILAGWMDADFLQAFSNIIQKEKKKKRSNNLFIDNSQTYNNCTIALLYGWLAQVRQYQSVGVRCKELTH